MISELRRQDRGEQWGSERRRRSFQSHFHNLISCSYTVPYLEIWNNTRRMRSASYTYRESRKELSHRTSMLEVSNHTNPILSTFKALSRYLLL
jgi:hypothetical protein